MEGAARTQAPTTTNYDVGSATWADLRKAPLQSAMEVTSLGHRPSWSSIDPAQVSMLFNAIHFTFITHSSDHFDSYFRCGASSEGFGFLINPWSLLSSCNMLLPNLSHYQHVLCWILLQNHNWKQTMVAWEGLATALACRTLFIYALVSSLFLMVQDYTAGDVVLSVFGLYL